MNFVKIIVLVVLLGLAVVGGRVAEKYCYRFPTEEEMSNYHSSHFSTKLIKLESNEYTKKNGSECVVFKGLHKPSGADEVYFVEAGKRWVMPWQEYNWKTVEPEEED